MLLANIQVILLEALYYTHTFRSFFSSLHLSTLIINVFVSLVAGKDKNILLISSFDVGQAQNWNVISIF